MGLFTGEDLFGERRVVPPCKQPQLVVLGLAVPDDHQLRVQRQLQRGVESGRRSSPGRVAPARPEPAPGPEPASRDGHLATWEKSQGGGGGGGGEEARGARLCFQIFSRAPL